MIENLECRRFRNRIDAFIDNELSTSEREEMLRHAQQCPECGKLLREYQDMLSLMQKMDEETVIPPEAAVKPPISTPGSPSASTALSTPLASR